MLKQVRTALKGVAAWFVIVLLVLAFALWGVPELRTFTQRAPLRVGDKAYSAQSILAEFNRQMNARRNDGETQYDREKAIADGLPDQVVNILVTRSVLDQEAAKMGLVMPRALIREFIKTDKQFQNPTTGEHDPQIVDAILSYNQWSPSQFEALLREDRLRSQLVASLTADTTAPEAMAQGIMMRQAERRRVAYLTVTDEMAGAPEEPTPVALETYYKENESSFMAPEYRSFTLVVLKSSDFSEGLEAPEEALRKAYEATKARAYETPERRTVYQITYDAEAEAQAAAAALRQGEPFETVAEDKGLALGAVTLSEIKKSDILDPAVAAAVFSPELKAGEVAGPVKGLFGWTVAQAAAILPPETKTFDEVRDELAAQYTEQDVKKRLFAAIEEIENARDTGAPLAAAAEAAGLAAKHVGPVDSFSFAPGGAILADIPGAALAQAFKLGEGEESEAEALVGEDGYFFVQVEEVTPPALKPYEAIADEVVQRWRNAEKRHRVENAVAEITKAIADGATLEKAAEPFNRAVLTADLRRGAQAGFSAPLLDEIFKADKGEIVTGRADIGPAQIIAELREIGFDPRAFGPGDKAAAQQYLGYLLNQELLDAYVAALRADYGVKAEAGALAQIFNEGA